MITNTAKPDALLTIMRAFQRLALAGLGLVLRLAYQREIRLMLRHKRGNGLMIRFKQVTEIKKWRLDKIIPIWQGLKSVFLTQHIRSIIKRYRTPRRMLI